MKQILLKQPHTLTTAELKILANAPFRVTNLYLDEFSELSRARNALYKKAEYIEGMKYKKSKEKQIEKLKELKTELDKLIKEVTK